MCEWFPAFKVLPRTHSQFLESRLSGLNIANRGMNFIPLLDSVLESTVKTNLGVNGKPRLPVHKDQNEVTLMKWPAQSLDLNIIENIFFYVFQSDICNL